MASRPPGMPTAVRWSRHELEALPGEHLPDELIPLLHRGPLLLHVVPAVIVLRADVLEGMVLNPVADFLGL